MNKKLLVSACLLGINSKYNSSNNTLEILLENSAKLDIIPVCPEQLGGLPTPRPACEIQNCATGKDVLNGQALVLNKDGQDVTPAFLKGAYETLRIAKIFEINHALLKKRSPSCGTGFIYDGSFCGNLHEGNGVTAELLLKNNIKVFNENDVNDDFIRRFSK